MATIFKVAGKRRTQGAPYSHKVIIRQPSWYRLPLSKNKSEARSLASDNDLDYGKSSQEQARKKPIQELRCVDKLTIPES